VRRNAESGKVMAYAILKLIHVSAVAISFLGFAARGLGALSDASWVRHRLTRTLPHLIDTVLLLSAVGMLWVIRLSPWALPWLRAKLVGLIIYIALGVIALRPVPAGRTARSRTLRLIAWIGALAAFGYIVSVALTKSPLGALVWLPG
jgi:uncharacterized membrane protein SirB2